MFDALLAASKKGLLPTALDTAGLRNLAAEIRRNAFFTAQGTSVAFVSAIQQAVVRMAAGEWNESTARAYLMETIRGLGYTPEGGFPDAPAGSVPPALAGTIQDLSSWRRIDLIVRTQLELAQGAGLQMAGHTEERVAMFPAWELIRELEVDDARDWPARWVIAGGRGIPDSYPKNAHLYVGEPTGMIALKGDPVWGELGSSETFGDALDTDHPPFAFNSGMGWREVSAEEVREMGITGPNGEGVAEWFEGRPLTMAGPLPAPRISMRGVGADLLESFQASTGAVPVPGKPDLYELPPAVPEDELSTDEIIRRAAARRDEELLQRERDRIAREGGAQ